MTSVQLLSRRGYPAPTATCVGWRENMSHASLTDCLKLTYRADHKSLGRMPRIAS